MASISAELRVAGRTYSLRRCDYNVHQSTDGRGRVITKVRYGRIVLLLDVPRDSFLGAWAADADKRCAVDIVFCDANGGQALETVHLAGAYCVHYEQYFREGTSAMGPGISSSPSSYVVHLELSDPDGYTWKTGGPGTYVAPGARDHGPPQPVTLTSVAPLTEAQELTAKQQRYNKRMGLLDRARAQLAESAPLAAAAGPFPADATRVAPGAAASQLVAEQRRKTQAALTRLSRNNVAVERARLSEHVYHLHDVPPRPAPPGWHLLSPKELARKGISPAMLEDPASGFKAAMYESGFERPPKLVIAYAGTEDGPDWAANFQQGVGLETKQYNMAMQLAKQVMKTTDAGKVDLTGHSLGGGLASAGVAVTGAKGYTFNSAGLHSATVGRPPYSISPEQMRGQGARIDAYHSTADPLTNFQDVMQGSVGGLAGSAVGWPLAPLALGIPHALVPAEGWQHEWSELARNNPFTKSANMALEGHGIDPQVVDHIEAQKDEDTATLTKYVGGAP